MKRFLLLVRTKWLWIALMCVNMGVHAAQKQADSTAVSNYMPYVFLDCSHCDFNYIRQELDFVNYVRDPEQADIHVFVTDQSTGDGGRKYEFSFIGRNDFSGSSFLLEHTCKRDATSDEVRKELAAILQQGFVSYLLQTNTGSNFYISYDQHSGINNNGQSVNDKWNNWIFEAYLGSIRLNMQSNRSDFYSRWEFLLIV